MNFLRGRKKQDDQPATPPSASASNPTSAQRASQRVSSGNGITIPPRTNSSVPNPSNGQAPGPGQAPGTSPRGNNPDQQQQPYCQQQQQHPYQQQHDSDSGSLSSSQQLQPMQMQAMPQHGSYGNDPMLTSQSVQYPSYQDQSIGMEGGYDGGYAGGAQDDQHHGYQQQQQQQQQNDAMTNNNGQQDGYYSQTNAGFENSGTVLTSGPIQLPGQGGNGSPNGGSNGSDGINSGTIDAGELSTDVRKLQDEVSSWKKSQESSQAKVNQLRQTLTQKSQENRELHASLTQVMQDRLMLQELVHKREKEMDDLRSKYLNDVRQIRATDDDHATIEQRIRMLQAAILQLTKSSSGDRAVNLNVEEAQSLVKKKYKFGNTQPYILN
ncbi:hypothetical protein BGZ98_007756, partial [Dissophora globulifera]